MKWLLVLNRTQHYEFSSFSSNPCVEGSLSNDDGDGKKEIVLDWQNKNFTRVSLFFVHFFAVVARLRRESA